MSADVLIIRVTICSRSEACGILPCYVLQFIPPTEQEGINRLGYFTITTPRFKPKMRNTQDTCYKSNIQKWEKMKKLIASVSTIEFSKWENEQILKNSLLTRRDTVMRKDEKTHRYGNHRAKKIEKLEVHVSSWLW